MLRVAVCSDNKMVRFEEVKFETAFANSSVCAGDKDDGWCHFGMLPLIFVKRKNL